jgi:uncharacterized protein YbjT (DUF2867 family)
MKIVIAGDAGQVGQILVRALSTRGHDGRVARLSLELQAAEPELPVAQVFAELHGLRDPLAKS